MFIRIVSKSQITTTYECYKVTYTPHDITQDPKLTHGTLFITNMQKETIEIEVDFNNESVYYMNHEGKTIEVLNQID